MESGPPVLVSGTRGGITTPGFASGTEYDAPSLSTVPLGVVRPPIMDENKRRSLSSGTLVKWLSVSLAFFFTIVAGTALAVQAFSLIMYALVLFVVWALGVYLSFANVKPRAKRTLLSVVIGFATLALLITTMICFLFIVSDACLPCSMFLTALWFNLGLLLYHSIILVRYLSETVRSVPRSYARVSTDVGGGIDDGGSDDDDAMLRRAMAESAKESRRDNRSDFRASSGPAFAINDPDEVSGETPSESSEDYEAQHIRR